MVERADVSQLSPDRTVLMLMGATATGKTELAVSLAATHRIEIISVDSAMVYRGLDIGAGKPDAETLRAAPHRLIDIRDPDQPYSAAEFRRDAVAEIAAIHAGGKVPLLVGGTGLYFRALCTGLSALPAAAPEIRSEIEEEAAQLGWNVMHTRLRACDPESAERIHPNDLQRIQRALEVYRVSGERMSDLVANRRPIPLPCRTRTLALWPCDREALHQDIEKRFRSMLKAGLVDEVRSLRQRWPDSPLLPAMRAVGYRQVWRYLAGEVGHDEMVESAIAATRQLARRQLTWLRRERIDLRLDRGATDIEALAQRWLEDAIGAA